MGNQGSSLSDEPNSIVAQKNLHHFDHTFKAELHTAYGSKLSSAFGVDVRNTKRPITIICKGSSLEIIEEVGITTKKQIEISYNEIHGISWDHGNSEVKFDLTKDDNGEVYIIIILANSIEFEGEVKLRFNGVAATHRGVKIPSPMYIGMFAGASKPKPFQRKRPNLSRLPSGKLPQLMDMRNQALELHKGSYRPCPAGESRRLAIALQHIYEGENTFPLINVRGNSALSNQYRSDSVLVISDESLVFRSKDSSRKVDIPFDDIEDWNAIDNDTYRRGDSGIEIVCTNGDKIYFGFNYVRDVKHSFEYFWNRYKVNSGYSGSIKLGSTHGRPLVSVQTLSGEVPPPDPPVGQSEVVDQDGIVVRPGAKIVPRRSSIGSISTSKEPRVVPPENRQVKKHWHKVVLHQGWLLKQGGVGVGNAKAWIKRYFVLYKTSQGHFLVYYSDFTECPMYTTEQNHRNIVDLAKTTFIRPGSNKSSDYEVPPFSFDLITTEREWTLCAESQDNAQKWLKIINYAVDQDVAILPDEELIFKVKPKVDPMGLLPPHDYSTSLKVSANGVSVCCPDVNKPDTEKEHYFWVYTDFYKWSLLSQAGKPALLVNVFADSSFSRRNEYTFRTKETKQLASTIQSQEAVRLATAIEYFIEKFMSVMHIRLETTPGIFDNINVSADDEQQKGGMHQVNIDDFMEDEVDIGIGQSNVDVDLLGFDLSSKSNHSSPAKNLGSNSVDLFGDDPFGTTPPSLPQKPNKPAPIPHQSTNLLDDDFAPAVASNVVSNAGLTTSGFGDDPFGDDPFGNAFVSPAAKVEKIAPPLTPYQTEQHKAWLSAAIVNNGGLIYDDGTLSVSSKIEIRGSQCRFSLNYSNNSPASISDLTVTVNDPSGLIRFETTAPQSSLAGLGKTSQIIMLECIKPAAPGASLTISYLDSLVGRRSNTINLPLVVTLFNEPLTLGGEDFMNRWKMLVAPGQEVQEILKPTQIIVPNQIHIALVSVLKFGRVSDIADCSEFVIYGASSLRTGALTPTGEKINVGSLIKIEMNVQSNAMRVTLRTIHPAASVSILQTIKSLLL